MGGRSKRTIGDESSCTSASRSSVISSTTCGRKDGRGGSKHATKKEDIGKFSFKSESAAASMISRFSYSTKMGAGKKENQDALIVSPKLLGTRSMHLFGVCDGHGLNGKQASERA